jgi:cellobiose phosphorylase
MIEVLKQALEALEKHYPYEDESGIIKLSLGRYMNGLQYLRQAIAELESQEPVAWMYVNIDGECEDIGYGKTYLAGLDGCTPLYTHPPQRTWVGLTDEEIDKAWRSVDYTVPWEQHRIDIAKAIEAKLKERNDHSI